MILRTPPQRKRRAGSSAGDDADLALLKSVGGASATGRSPVSDRRLVLYDRPAALVPADAPGLPFDDMVCTYHCRQMVRSLRPFLVLLWVFNSYKHFVTAIGSCLLLSKHVIDVGFGHARQNRSYQFTHD